MLASSWLRESGPGKASSLRAYDRGQLKAVERPLKTPLWNTKMTVAVYQDVCSAFLEKVRTAHSRALLLDYDGTLAPFTPDRDRAFPYREIPELISEIMRHQTRVVLISGRPATELLFLSG